MRFIVVAFGRGTQPSNAYIEHIMAVARQCALQNVATSVLVVGGETNQTSNPGMTEACALAEGLQQRGFDCMKVEQTQRGGSILTLLEGVYAVRMVIKSLFDSTDTLHVLLLCDSEEYFWQLEEYGKLLLTSAQTVNVFPVGRPADSTVEYKPVKSKAGYVRWLFGVTMLASPSLQAIYRRYRERRCAKL